MKKIILLVVMFTLTNLLFSEEGPKKYSYIEKMQLNELSKNVKNLIQNQYVTEHDVDYEKLTYGYVSGFINHAYKRANIA